MGKPSNNSETKTDRFGWVKSLTNKDSHKKDPVLPLTNPHHGADSSSQPTTTEPTPQLSHSSSSGDADPLKSLAVTDKTSAAHPQAAPPTSHTQDAGEKSTAIDVAHEQEPKLPLSKRAKAGAIRFGSHTKGALLHSWINVLLIFVPLGIAVKVAGLSPAIVFSMNAVAVIPLAGLLAHATESVAGRLGDTLGALLNVSFGNAVELIIL
jgi:Ca2+:H+ antiporter